MNILIVFGIALLFFHSTEFLLNGYFHHKWEWKAFLISIPYLLVLSISIGEYYVESYFIPVIKSAWLLKWLGLAGIVLGQNLRWYAVIHARHAFTHLVRTNPGENHHLVTTGPYSYVRHPGYLGFFIWAVSIQLMLMNPFSFLLSCFILLKYFRSRIRYEEKYLVNFFGDAYLGYKEKIWSGMG